MTDTKQFSNLSNQAHGFTQPVQPAVPAAYIQTILSDGTRRLFFNDLEETFTETSTTFYTLTPLYTTLQTVSRETLVKWLDALGIEVTDRELDDLFPSAIITAAPAHTEISK